MLRTLSLVTILVAIAATVLAVPLPTTRIIDRQFPVDFWCPVETRDGALVEFTAASAEATVTFSLANYVDGFFADNHLDNVVVVAKSTYDANHAAVPGFSDCYFVNPDAPSYVIADPDAITGVVFADLFDDDSQNWSGGSLDAATSAPRNTATGTDPSQGSLAVGTAGDGDTSVSASISVTDLISGTDYVVVAWWNTSRAGQLTILVQDGGPVSVTPRSFGRIKALY